MGVGVNEVPILKGVANLFDKQLAGTANNYSDETENTDKLFLCYFTLDCSELGDYTDGNCTSLQNYQLNEGDSFAISIRNFSQAQNSGRIRQAFYLRWCSRSHPKNGIRTKDRYAVLPEN